jgi:hypothetical protein
MDYMNDDPVHDEDDSHLPNDEQGQSNGPPPPPSDDGMPVDNYDEGEGDNDGDGTSDDDDLFAGVEQDTDRLRLYLKAARNNETRGSAKFFMSSVLVQVVVLSKFPLKYVTWCITAADSAPEIYAPIMNAAVKWCLVSDGKREFAIPAQWRTQLWNAIATEGKIQLFDPMVGFMLPSSDNLPKDPKKKHLTSNQIFNQNRTTPITQHQLDDARKRYPPIVEPLPEAPSIPDNQRFEELPDDHIGEPSNPISPLSSRLSSVSKRLQKAVDKSIPVSPDLRGLIHHNNAMPTGLSSNPVPASSLQDGDLFPCDPNDNLRLFAPKVRRLSLPDAALRHYGNVPKEYLTLKDHLKWNYDSPICFEVFCRQRWHDAFQFGRGVGTWLRLIERQVDWRVCDRLSSLLSRQGSYRCPVSHTLIPDLEFPRPNDWIRCASILVYNAKIRSDRLSEADALKFDPTEHTYAAFFYIAGECLPPGGHSFEMVCGDDQRKDHGAD